MIYPILSDQKSNTIKIVSTFWSIIHIVKLILNLKDGGKELQFNMLASLRGAPLIADLFKLADNPG